MHYQPQLVSLPDFWLPSIALYFLKNYNIWEIFLSRLYPIIYRVIYIISGQPINSSNPPFATAPCRCCSEDSSSLSTYRPPGSLRKSVQCKLGNSSEFPVNPTPCVMKLWENTGWFENRNPFYFSWVMKNHLGLFFEKNNISNYPSNNGYAGFRAGCTVYPNGWNRKIPEEGREVSFSSFQEGIS